MRLENPNHDIVIDSEVNRVMFAKYDASFHIIIIQLKIPFKRNYTKDERCINEQDLPKFGVVVHK